MTPEPVLREDDIEAWNLWQRAAAAWATTASFERHVEAARRIIRKCMDETPNAAVSWSGGKDSTVMTHLVCVDCKADVAVFSEKDDLDYPGEEEYVRGLGDAWGLKLTVLHPPISPREWIEQHRAQMNAGDEIHARAAGLSKACFYNVMKDANRGYDAVMLGLRTEESAIRRNLRATRGRYYELADGSYRVLPIADWKGLDVYAYAISRGIALLPVYQCLGLMHRHDPSKIRKSWWLPGGTAQYGQVTWLRRYYPSLYRQLLEWFPDATMM